MCRTPPPPQVLEPIPERAILWRGWRDGRHAPPSDAPPCGFDNERCQVRPMIVFALCAMATALLVGAGFAWRWVGQRVGLLLKFLHSVIGK